MKLEQILNTLIQKGWKPFNVDCAWTNVEVINRLRDNQYLPEHSKIIFKTENHWHVFDCNIRDLVSKESNLRQFCCDSKLIEQGKTVHDFVMKHICYADENRCGGFSMCNAEYYIMMCSLLEVSELEKFLFDNIKVDGIRDKATNKITDN